MSQAFWLFAYGSLIWRPKFTFEQRVRCYVEGYGRRFWQASTDHRGTSESPGRVVTLVPAAGELCWGVAYRIGQSDVSSVVRQLDERERGGYLRLNLACHAKDRTTAGVFDAVAYVATPSNPHYVGEQTLEEIAQVVRTSRGPSGHNAEYVLQLADALLELGAADAHVFELANLVSDPQRVGEEESV